MHENSVARSLVNTIDTLAASRGAQAVVSAQVRLGELAFMTEEDLREHFIHASKGTRAEGALLLVHSNSNGEDEGTLEGLVLESVELQLEPGF